MFAWFVRGGVEGRVRLCACMRTCMRAYARSCAAQSCVRVRACAHAVVPDACLQCFMRRCWVLLIWCIRASVGACVRWCVRPLMRA